MDTAEKYLDLHHAIFKSNIKGDTSAGEPRSTVKIKDGKITEIRVHQHSLKIYQSHFEKLPICWKRMWHTQLLRDVSEETTESQMRGLYFESQCIGKTAYGYVNELPRLLNGKKSVHNIRIDEQIFNFKSIMKEDRYGIILVDDGFGNFKNCQIKNKKKLDIEDFEGMDIYLEGTADIISSIDFDKYQYEKACIDLKLTMDRNNTFGPYGWGEPSKLDHIQAYVYSYLFDMPFFYWVFDYNSRDRGEKIIPVNTDINHPDNARANEARIRFKETKQIIRSFCADILYNEAMDWPTNPKYSRCKNCPVVCPDRKTVEEV